ncbi:Uncharacterized protein OBRU01_02506 [Operophtera brumata]|uniref:Sulfate transporter n=1 Tax=Operophtera brumata TaxID=104452 RepID=A0A0L7LSR4_OPEBR|nr:Uncharacterized protein OBRU01_02506 [Operophtera brumata]
MAVLVGTTPNYNKVKYNSEKAIGDLIAGVTVGLTVIPQSLAYSNIAGLPPQHGLYGSFLGCFIYIFLGGCRAVAGGVVEKAILLTLLAGIVELLMGVLGLGFLVNFVSGPVSSGFTSAVALMIATSQVKDLFAITVTGDTFLQQWISIFKNLHNARPWDPVLGFICIALLLLMRKIGMIKLGEKSDDGPSTRQKLVTKCLWMVGTCRNAIVVVATGKIPSGVPVPQLPPFSYVRPDNTTADFLDMVSELGSGLVVIPLIVLLEDIAICKAFSDGRTIDATQEMIAMGVAGIANSFMQAYPELDLVPGVGTFVLCLTLPIELGILTGVIVNIIFILYHAARPKFSVELLRTEAGVEYLMITPDRCLMFPSVDYVRRLVTKCAASSSVPVVIECTHIYSADYTAATSIDQLTADFQARRQPLYFYNVKPSVCSIFEAVAKPENFVVFYEDDELDRLLAADERLHDKRPVPPITPGHV